MKQLFYHAQVVTMEEDQNGQVITEQSVLVQDGTIIAVGEEKKLEQMAGENCEKIDCQGKALLPAFIDSHSHITALAQSLAYCDLSTATSFEEIEQQLLDFTRKSPLCDGQYVIGFGYDHNNLKEQKHPDRHFLDRTAEKILKQDQENFPGNRVEKISMMLSHASGHMGIMGSSALSHFGIDKSTPNPSDGIIGREEDGTPNGYLEENSFIQLTSKIPQPSKEEQLRRIEQAQKVYWSYGITTIQDGLTKQKEWNLLKELAQTGRLKTDVVCYADLKDNRSLIKENPEYTKGYNKHLRLGGYKIFLDGSPQGKTAWLTKPYEGESEYCGYPIYTDEQVKEFVKESIEDSQQLLAHCNGDAASQQYLDACRLAGDTRKIRPVIVHAQTLRLDQIPKLKPLGMIPSYFVAHTWFWGDVHLKNLGEQRAKQISPLKSTLENKIPYTLHQDSPVIPPDMMKTVWCAVNRRSKTGQSMGDDQKISVKDALKGITVNAAYQYFEEKDKGSICVGKRADFVLLSENPLTENPEKLDRIQILKTFSQGELVYSR